MMERKSRANSNPITRSGQARVPKATITQRVDVLATIRLTIEAPTDGTNNNDISRLGDSTNFKYNCWQGKSEGLVKLSIITVSGQDNITVMSQRHTTLSNWNN
jgi:hypothetical protein